jgi:Zn-dependent M28 family amino/carboxypeptidase
MKLIFLTLLLSFVANFSAAQESNRSAEIDFFKHVIATLASDSLAGRPSATVYETKSLLFIAQQFDSLNHQKLKSQKFSIVLNDENLVSRNGYFFKNNKKKQTVVLGAHYDHIGHGSNLSMCASNNQIHNGADDNASGVAMLLLISNYILNLENPKYNFIIVFYSAHEIGLFGSQKFFDFIRKKSRRFGDITFCLNFDMVGRIDPSLMKLKLMHTHLNQSLVETLKTIPSLLNIAMMQDDKFLNQLDTKWFSINSIPCLHFTSGRHIDYHCPSDDAQYINYGGMLAIFDFVKDVLKKLN